VYGKKSEAKPFCARLTRDSQQRFARINKEF